MEQPTQQCLNGRETVPEIPTEPGRTVQSGCPFAGGGFNANRFIPKENGQNSGNSAHYKFPTLNENHSKKIPKGGMLYGDYLHVSLPILLFVCVSEY